MAATSNFNPPHANTVPSAAPAMARTRLSIISSLMSRARLAPRAARRENSLSRVVARASIRFATLLHAINSNKPTAASTVYRVALKCSTTVSPMCFTSTVNCAG